MQHSDNLPDSDVDVLLAGMLFMDIVFTGLPERPAPGTEVWATGMGSSPGGIANLAVATARLGLRTGLSTTFGDDGYGAWCRGILSDDEGIDLSLSVTLPQWHTAVTVSMAYDDDRSMVTHGHRSPRTSAELVGDRARPRAVIADLGDDPWWHPAANRGAKVFADIGWDPEGAWDPAILAELDGCHCFMPNAVEACAYTRTETPQKAVRKLADLVPLAVVTMGSDGVIAVDGTTGEREYACAVPSQAIDPTGAGDVFGASLVVGTLAGWPLADRLKFSALCASLAVRQFGGALAAPGWGDVTDWYQCTSAAADDGDENATRLRNDYAFLPEVIPATPVRTLRRAEATLAIHSDVGIDPRRRTSRHSHHPSQSRQPSKGTDRV